MPLTPEQAEALGLPTKKRTLSAEEAASLGLPVKVPPKITPEMGGAKAFGLGTAQGATAGFADEAEAAARSALSGARSLNQPLRLTPGPRQLARMYPGLTYPAAAARWFDENRPDLASAKEAEAQRQGQQGRYLLNVGEARKKYQQAQTDRPGLYLGGNIAGMVATAPAQLGLKGATGLGMLQGAGFSEAGPDEPLGLSRDIGIGGLGGAAGQTVGKGLSWAGNKIRSAVAPRLAAAEQKVAELATAKVGKPISQAAGALGGETQVGSRYVENLMRLDESFTPAQRAAYDALVAKGVVPDLQHAIAQSTLENLPGQAATIAARRAELRALQEAAPEALKKAMAEIGSSSGRADAASWLRSYGEPWIWAGGANVLARALDLSPEQQAWATAAGLAMGGRTRGGKALRTRLAKPGNQLALLNRIQGAGSTVTGEPSQALARALAAAMAARAIQEQERDQNGP